MYGWAGTLLRVNLSDGKIQRQEYPEALRHQFLGGRGVNWGIGGASSRLRSSASMSWSKFGSVASPSVVRSE